MIIQVELVPTVASSSSSAATDMLHQENVGIAFRHEYVHATLLCLLCVQRVGCLSILCDFERAVTAEIQCDLGTISPRLTVLVQPQVEHWRPQESNSTVER